jgi:signal transduction histidine kinase/pSer/pThr/pTyr-binding forkhead associated (FHA) protein
MIKTKLVISGPKETQEVSLEPKGVTLGRGSKCDVVLDHSNVSRVHARISQDPFGRWIIEDMDSYNGILINGQRIKAQAVLPNQEISIHPFILHLLEEPDEQTGTGAILRTTIPVVDKGMEENIVSYKTSPVTVLSPDLMHHLNEFIARLLELSSPSDLYSEACLCLASMFDTLVAIVRLPCGAEPMSGPPEILACNLGANTTDISILQASYLHLSKRVLDAVRKTDVPVMASSGPSSSSNLVLTVVDTHKPHLVFSARVHDLGETIDALYIDILQDKSPKEMFDFVEAVSRQVNFTQKNLFFTELKKQEQAAREANVQLKEANLQLKEKDRIKDEYVARVTHDIKGHLAAIQSCLYIAADESSGTLNEKQSDFMSRSRNRTMQLTNFVKELLNLTQMRLSGQLQMEPFSLPDSISKALASVATNAADKSITVTSDVEPSLGQIVGNEFSINEMVSNLLLNAVKYTPEGKSVHLEAKSQDDSVHIEISDKGIGIPENELGNVFEEFFRASNAKKREKDGTGLGLSIVKQIIERHGGKISVKSKEGQGTTFSVVLLKNNIQ